LNEQYRLALGFSNPVMRAHRLLDVSKLQAEAGDVLSAQNSLRDAARAAGAVESLDVASQLRIQIAGRWSEMGERGVARELISMVHKAIFPEKEDVGYIADASRRIDVATQEIEFVERYDLAPPTWEGIDQVLDSCNTWTEEIDDTRFLLEAFAKMAATMHVVGRTEAAAELVNEVQMGIQSIDDPRLASDVLAILAVYLDKMERRDDAQAAFLQAAQSLERVEDPASRAYGWLEIAAAQNRIGLSARQAISNAESVTATIGDAGMQEAVRRKIGDLRSQR
jgi:hypothetical protein